MTSFSSMTQNVSKKIVNYKTVMEKSMEKMKRADYFAGPVRESKLIDESKLSDLKLKAWTSFKDVAARRSADLGTFRVACGNFAAQQNARLLDLTVACVIKGEKILGALSAAACAFKEAMKK